MTALPRSGTDRPARRPRPVPQVLLDLDRELFEPHGWFALDARNTRVPGVVVPSLTEGLELVGCGPVATVVGQLRDEVRVVDVDLSGESGHAAAEAVAAWCEREGLWCLVRPSGGADGRSHVFVVLDGRLGALNALVEDLRVQLHAGRRRLEVRRAVRPLSVPHRSGTVTRPYGRLLEALTQLRAHPWAKKPLRASQSVASTSAALPARRRPRATLPEPWQAYLRGGTPPPIGGTDTSRSTVEAIATGHLLRAGYDADSAWQVITAAHSAAFQRARTSRRRWVAWVWNRAVEDDNAFIPDLAGDVEVLVDVEAARGRLEQLAWSLPGRQRPALLLVGHTVLDRMLRTGGRRVPVPERDLVLDTGLADRKTIRAQLRAMNGLVGDLDTSTWDSRRGRDSSSFEFEIPQVAGLGVSQFPPPSSHTPIRPGVWGLLPAAAHQLWRALIRRVEPVSLVDLVQDALLTERLDSSPSPGQVRAARRALTALATAGLAHCTEASQWVARAALDPEVAVRAETRRAELQRQVTAERDAYRCPAGSDWDIARAAALKANRAREVAWWQGLPRAERERRRAAFAVMFAQLSVHDQEQVKATLVERRMRAGVDESARHDQWLDGLSWDGYLDGSTTRSAWFGRLPGPMRQAYAAAWARHRARYGISRGTPASQSCLQYAAAAQPDPTRAA